MLETGEVVPGMCFRMIQGRRNGWGHHSMYLKQVTRAISALLCFYVSLECSIIGFFKSLKIS